MYTYEYSVGDRVTCNTPSLIYSDPSSANGTVVYADPIGGGVVRWDDGCETGYTWDELGNLKPAKHK